MSRASITATEGGGGDDDDNDGDDGGALSAAAVASRRRDGGGDGNDDDTGKSSDGSQRAATAAGDGASSVAAGPLSWRQARWKLRTVLEKYLSEQQQKHRDDDCLAEVNRPAGTGPAGGGDETENPDDAGGEPARSSSSVLPLLVVLRRTLLRCCNSALNAWLKYDCDLYVGALLFSSALLVLACWSFVTTTAAATEDGSSSRVLLLTRVYRAQIAGATLLLAGSFMSIWMVRRRRYLCSNDSYTSKRRQVLRFLRNLAHEEECDDGVEGDGDGGGGNGIDPQYSHHSSTFLALERLQNVSGTSLTDIYPVYRKVVDNADDDSGDLNETSSWSRIPSLLLVEGDYIALQIGDIAPADCTLIPLSSPHEGQQQPNTAAGAADVVVIKAGTTVTLGMIGEGSSSAAHLASKLPQGRSTVPADSPHLLTLCNGTRLYRVVATPMAEFVRHETGNGSMRKLLLLCTVYIYFIQATVH